jgi:phosphoribosyl-AMP cyclohydrolase
VSELEEGTRLALDFGKLAAVAATGAQVVPVVLQDTASGEVLFIGYANKEALEASWRERIAVLWSTSRNELWRKGSTSGDVLELVDIRVNCEQNSLLYRVRRTTGGACHTLLPSGSARPGCYYRTIAEGMTLQHLAPLPGSAADAPSVSLQVPLPATSIGAASAADLTAMADLINQAERVAIFGGDGCAQAQDEVRELAARLKAPVGYSLKGKAWLEHDNPNAVGMTGLLGYGGCHGAINNADVLLMLGTDFPFSEFLPRKKVKTIQVDRDPGHIGRRAPLELGVVGDVAATLRDLAPMVHDKHADHFLREHVTETEHWRRRLGHYVTKGPGIKPIRPAALTGAHRAAAVLSAAGASWAGEEDSARRMISVTVSSGNAVESMTRW